jgi:hypothetical protein
LDTRTHRRLRLDRRLIHRRGWIPAQELERELAALPDASDKAAASHPEGEENAAASREDAEASSAAGD